MADNSDKLARAYARLRSLKENLPPREKHIAESYATEFHSALDSLAQLGIGVEEFRVSPNQIKPHIMAAIPGRSAANSSIRYVERNFLLVKIDAVLNYLQMVMTKESARMGFEGSKES